MSSEKQKGKVVELPTPQVDPPMFIQRRTRTLRASVRDADAENSGDLVRLAGQTLSQEAHRQRIQNLAGFFSQSESAGFGMTAGTIARGKGIHRQDPMVHRDGASRN